MKVKLILAVALVLGIFVAAFLFSSRRPEQIAEPVLDGVMVESSNVVVGDETPYELGYRTGYRAFQLQMGEEVPCLVRYTSSSDTVESLGEEASKGYVDGYHRAAASYVCPRCPY